MRSIVAAALAVGALAAQGNRMNESSIQLWQWLRQFRSVSLCRIEAVETQPSGDEEIVHLRLATLEKLWGPKPAEERRASFQQPTAPLLRLKVQTPVWKQVELAHGALLLYVADGPEREAKPLFAANTAKDDPSLAAMRQVTAFEREQFDDLFARKRQYLEWVRKGALVQRILAGEALTRDPLPGVDSDGQVASAVSEVLADDGAPPFLRISALEWLKDRLWSLTNPAGKAAGIRAEAKALSAKDANVRQFSQDALADLDPLRLREEGVVDAKAASLLREHAAALQEPARARLVALAEALAPRR